MPPPSPRADTPVKFADLVGDRIDLPSGGWVQLRHLDLLRSKHRNHVTKALPADGMTPAAVVAMQYALAEVMIVGWHLPYEDGAPLPSDQPATPTRPSILEEVSLKDENTLMKALEPVLALFNPKDVTPDDAGDPDSPTGPVGGSAPA